MSTFIDCFRKHVHSLTGHTIVNERESFARIETVLVRSCIMFSDVFITRVKEQLGVGEQEGVLEKFLEKIKTMISSVFREALLPAMSEAEEFPISGFAVRLQQQLKKQIATLKLLDSEWRIMHSLSVEPVGTGMVGVYSGFAFDAFLTSRFPILDFKISNFEVEGKLIDSNGKTHTDLLRLDAIEELDLFTKARGGIEAQT